MFVEHKINSDRKKKLEYSLKQLESIGNQYKTTSYLKTRSYKKL